MKAILISIKPEWIAKILNGEKTIEIRRTMPKCELPIDVYIYCTKGKRLYYQFGWYDENGITVNDYWHIIESLGGCYGFNGKVVAKFTLNKVEKIEFDITCITNSLDKLYTDTNDENKLLKNSCLTKEQISSYLKLGGCFTYLSSIQKGYFSGGYAWHIDNLVIFDSSKELSGGWFTKRDCRTCPFNHEDMDGDECIGCIIEKATRGWCYVEV